MRISPAIRTSFLTDRPGQVLRPVLLILVGTVLLTASAKLQVPFWPVPVTMQSLVVLLIGFAYGRTLGAATMLAYLAEGLAGLPVFAGAAAGPAYLAGPTAGYLVGFVLAAFLAGWVAERGWLRSPIAAALTLTAGHVIIVGLGVLWLATLLGPARAVALGATPFLLGTLVKVGLGAALVAATGLGRRAGPV
ncbi:MAG: biotin transporter BioY [Acetobacteraceae bacterium]